MAVVPRYSNYEEGWETGVRVRMRVMGSDTEVHLPSSFLFLFPAVALPRTAVTLWKQGHV